MAFRFVVNALTVFTKKNPNKITLDFIVYYEMKYVTIWSCPIPPLTQITSREKSLQTIECLNWNPVMPVAFKHSICLYQSKMFKLSSWSASLRYKQLTNDNGASCVFKSNKDRLVRCIYVCFSCWIKIPNTIIISLILLSSVFRGFCFWFVHGIK